MKHILKFNEQNIQIENIQVGDYVLCDETGNTDSDEDINEFITQNVGKCVHICTLKLDNEYDYVVHYDLSRASSSILILSEIEINFHSLYSWTRLEPDRKILNCRAMKKDEIKFFSPNKKEVENFRDVYLSANKYNL